MITLRQMRYFDALATTRHFGRAAEMVNVSQPALSAQIAEMERHLDVKVIERNRSGALLTRQGEALLPDIRAILLSVDALYDRARQATGVLEGRLRLGIIPTVAPYLVPKLIPMMRQRYPKLDVELRELLTTGCVDDVKHGKLDCAIIALPHGDDSLQSRPLFEDRFLIASAEDENTVLVSPMTEAQVDMDRLLLLEEGHCLRDQALAVCGTNAGRSVANYGATSMATLLQMVSHGMGITLIPEIAVKDERTRNRMRIVPFAEPQPSRQIGLIWRNRSGRDGDQQALAALVTEAAGELLG
ncbi:MULTISPECIES: hydrogen peroxide-inducible genes activator [unclassified Rhizobium]|uniref:hydrogen peroxide-inducible genes activator n=1 Tax=unclassified Rhizobium TaxID=2613769 RepID=UPI0007143A76|nr:MULTISPECIES: hydrogen peroxide-inducible genes activator [unclassified Rhizobium]KQS91141.1 LysR family transcriptional regulator [Rhizobium sp. Leaf391]KQS96143.1 LysR family transcriptional regulator [Rhizobium sp. Leaf386]KQU09782.1 LysR family transcriptional regulator [Rhizobium sp. Leaf453]